MIISHLKTSIGSTITYTNMHASINALRINNATIQHTRLSYDMYPDTCLYNIYSWYNTLFQEYGAHEKFGDEFKNFLDKLVEEFGPIPQDCDKETGKEDKEQGKDKETGKDSQNNKDGENRTVRKRKMVRVEMMPRKKSRWTPTKSRLSSQ